MFKQLIKRKNTILLIILAFITIVPLAVNLGLLLGTYVLVPYLSAAAIKWITTISAVTASLLMTQQNFSYFLTGKLTHPRFYGIAFVLCLLALSATVLATVATIQIALFVLILVPCALILGGVILGDTDLKKYRPWVLLVSLFLFFAGITLFISYSPFLKTIFDVLMCMFFFFRILFNSNELVRKVRTNAELTEEKWRWLVLKLINDTLFAYIIIFIDITTLFKT